MNVANSFSLANFYQFGERLRLNCKRFELQNLFTVTVIQKLLFLLQTSQSLKVPLEGKFSVNNLNVCNIEWGFFKFLFKLSLSFK